MNLATKKWVFLKLSSIILVPLMLWFIINFISVYDGDYSEVVSFFSNKTNKFLFSIFLIFTRLKKILVGTCIRGQVNYLRWHMT